MLHLFFSGVPSFPHYLVAKLHLNHRKASPCVFNFSFFLSSFYYRSSSWRLYMVVHQGFLSFFNCSSRFLLKLWPAKLYSKINMVLNTCFVLRSSSILHLAFRSAILSTLSFEVVLCHSWQFPSCFMIHMLSRMRYFKSINLFVGVILGYISPKAFPKECCYCGAYQWSKLSLYHIGGRNFSSRRCYQLYYLFLVA